MHEKNVNCKLYILLLVAINHVTFKHLFKEDELKVYSLKATHYTYQRIIADSGLYYLRLQARGSYVFSQKKIAASKLSHWSEKVSWSSPRYATLLLTGTPGKGFKNVTHVTTYNNKWYCPERSPQKKFICYNM